MKQPGEHCTLSPYDAVGEVVDGDYIRTGTGRTYLVERAHLMRSKRANRYRLSVVVMAPDHVVEEDATVHPLYWYAR